MFFESDAIAFWVENLQARIDGRAIVADGGVSACGQAQDEALLWGHVAGSHDEDYLVSADINDPAMPVFSCNCRSKVRPCKHTAALLNAYVEAGGFPKAEVPAALQELRDKNLEKAAKKAAKEAKGATLTAAKAASEAKKCATQLAGLDLAHKVLSSLMLAGLDNAGNAGLEAQVEELGDYYIPGVQAAARTLLDDKSLKSAVYLHTLISRGQSYLAQKQADYEAFDPQTSAIGSSARETMLGTSIEEQLGYAWKLSELRGLGRAYDNIDLIQVFFEETDNTARKQYVATGYWLMVGGPHIFTTRDYRPYKANNVTPKDSFAQVLTTNGLCIYPGAVNPRLRWEKAFFRKLTSADLQTVQAAGAMDYAPVIKL
jgi:hypothetical protein